MPGKFNLGIVPMTSTDDVGVNLHLALEALEFFKDKKPDLICFPENSLYFNFNKNLDKSVALKLEDSSFKALAKAAQQLQCFLHLGGIPLNEGGAVYNSSVLISPSGEVRIVYKKIHLFDVDVEGRTVRESLSFDAGATPNVIDINGWKIGLTICYDLRFSELFVHYHRQEVDLILVPSSFLVPTGRAHWHTLLKARAIETQAFVVAAAQVGVHKSQRDSSLAERQTWGESIAFDPWGQLLGSTESFDDLAASGETNAAANFAPAKSRGPILVELDKSLIAKTRAQIPMLSHRKLRF